MTYHQYCAFDREQLLEKLQTVMSYKRFKHVLGVEKTAIHLATINGYDTAKAGLAGLLHDYAKELSDETFLSLIDQYHLDPDLKKWNNNIWHGMVGIYKIREDLGVSDSEILNAIKIHTVGSSKMSLLDKIVYVADYIEPGRQFDLVIKARQIAEHDINAAVAYETMHTVAFLASKAQPIYPQTIDTYNSFIHYM